MRFWALVLVFFLAGCVGGNPSHVDASTAGSLRPEQRFTLKDTAGRELSLSDILKENKVVLLNFWATWCPPCQEEIPDLIRLQTQYKDRGFTVLGVDVAESAKKVSSFVAKHGMNYPIVLDADSEVSEKFQVVGIPTSLLVSSDGKILGEYHSASPELFRDVENASKNNQ